MPRSVVLLIGLWATTAIGAERQLAFPGAEGFGAYAKGGRRGKVLFVTNLNDNGPGSLRAAVDADDPRIVIFRVGGLIELKRSIVISSPFITIAGQTAPGDGICLKHHNLVIRDTHDVVVRHMRVWPGDVSKKELDALTVYNSHDVIIDHCSVGWGTDETLSVTGESRNLTGGTYNVSVQWCIIAESLNNSVHLKGEHGYGSLISYIEDGGISFHHNLYAHHKTRVPRPGALDNAPGLRLDWRNNVIYDWIALAGYSRGGRVQLNYINNVIKAGPSTRPKNHNRVFQVGDETMVFADGNISVTQPASTKDNWLMFYTASKEPLEPHKASRPLFEPPAATTDAATQAYERVLNEAGASLPKRDAIDQRIVRQVRTGSGRVIDSQSQVGGWPRYRSAAAPSDGDNDGMPDEWETANRFNPRSDADANQDADRDGYTNIEEFLNSTDPHAVD